ncbi:MAG: hypothetical protein ACXAE3_10020 [Candidatus Kariarchaeaceae archaeon]|jgi:hypothetical protein
MVKPTKESRLSFRITPELSDEIDIVIDNFDLIKDRSDFGTKAIKLYMSYLKEELEIKETIKDAIIALADEVGADDLPEIKRLKEFIERSG